MYSATRYFISFEQNIIFLGKFRPRSGCYIYKYIVIALFRHNSQFNIHLYRPKRNIVIQVYVQQYIFVYSPKCASYIEPNTLAL